MLFKNCSMYVLSTACNNLVDGADQDQTARFMESDLDLHCPQKTT